ncbi:MAG TPA: hypothetical protein VH186_28230 [Chloroflexia bacterium]|nr:hypothetical protein [Chloroflexia bacterium]
MSISNRFKGMLAAISLLLTTFLTVACGNSANPTVAPTTAPAAQATTVTTTTRAASTATSGVVKTAASTPTVATSDQPSLTEKLPERTVVRTFTDQQGRTIKLVYGRGSGHNGDYGWAHIYGKHFQGIWYDGGTLTTFPQAVGAKTPQDVINLINKSLQDKNPDNTANGRRSYNYPVPGTNKDIFTVVGSDGTIITSYPVPHGSKDED